MEKFVMLDSHTLPDADFHQEKEILSAAGIECVLAACKSVDEVVEAAKDAEYIGDNYFKITDEVLSRLPKLKAVIRYGIGYDVVDVDACSKREVALCNLPTYCVEDVATHAIALILDLVRKTTIFDRQVKKGNWDVGYGYATHRMSAKTLGLVGFGNIAKKLLAVMADCAYVAKNGINSFHKYKYATAEDVLQKVNESLVKNKIVSIASPNLQQMVDVTNLKGNTEHLATVIVKIQPSYNMSIPIKMSFVGGSKTNRLPTGCRYKIISVLTTQLRVKHDVICQNRTCSTVVFIWSYQPIHQISKPSQLGRRAYFIRMFHTPIT